MRLFVIAAVLLHLLVIATTTTAKKLWHEKVSNVLKDVAMDHENEVEKESMKAVRSYTIFSTYLTTQMQTWVEGGSEFRNGKTQQYTSTFVSSTVDSFVSTFYQEEQTSDENTFTSWELTGGDISWDDDEDVDENSCGCSEQTVDTDRWVIRFTNKWKHFTADLRARLADFYKANSRVGRGWMEKWFDAMIQVNEKWTSFLEEERSWYIKLGARYESTRGEALQAYIQKLRGELEGVVNDALQEGQQVLVWLRSPFLYRLQLNSVQGYRSRFSVRYRNIASLTWARTARGDARLFYVRLLDLGQRFYQRNPSAYRVWWNHYRLTAKMSYNFYLRMIRVWHGYIRGRGFAAFFRNGRAQWQSWIMRYRSKCQDAMDEVMRETTRFYSGYSGNERSLFNWMGQVRDRIRQFGLDILGDMNALYKRVWNIRFVAKPVRVVIRPNACRFFILRRILC